MAKFAKFPIRLLAALQNFGVPCAGSKTFSSTVYLQLLLYPVAFLVLLAPPGRHCHKIHRKGFRKRQLL